MRFHSLLLVVSLLVLSVGCTTLQRSTPPPTPPMPAAAADSEKPTPKKKSDFKDYDAVITNEAVTDKGVFHVHRVGGKLFFEIPDSLLTREMLLISRIAQTPANLSPFINAGSKTGEQVVQWQRQDKQILLRRKSYQNVADETLAISRSVESNNFEPIIAAFDIETIAEDSSTVVIDVTKMFTSDVPAISGLSSGQRTRFRVRRLDGSRTFIDEAKSFPLNVNVRHTLTFDAAQPPSNSDTGTISLQMYQSMVLLPEEPMMPRLADPRVGYFSVRQFNFGLDDLKAATQTFIRRWELIPSDKAAYLRGELVEPEKPIVYYLDPGTPERWRDFFCMGVEDWNTTFESAGFKNAIECRMPPTKEEDPDFDPEDVRYSTVRYVANTTRNAMGPSVSDPRSGEIIESDIVWYHNHMRSYRNRLMIETGAANPQARSLDIADELIGETMRQVIAHEIGHALGLPHNMIASASFPVDSLRSPTFTSEFGVGATIMDYTRQNYIAQPGDGVTRFVRMLGPYDHYSIEWGYRWYPDINDPEDEKAILDAMILEHADDPRFRFASSNGVDPRAQTEDMGDDPVQASTYAVANLQRVVPNLVDWTSEPGQGYAELEEIYGELLGMWGRYMGHVVTLVGGVEGNAKTSDQDGVVYTPVSRQKQEEAVQFIADNVFDTPTWLHDTEILRRIENAGAVDRIRSRQVRVLNSLLDPGRMQRLIEVEVLDPDTAYPLLDFMGDVRASVWGELDGRRPVIDTYRRNLQRGYLERMAYLLNEEPPSFSFFFGTRVDVSQSDIRAFVRGSLRDLQASVDRAASRTQDTATRYHLQDASVRIDALLDEGDA